MKTNDAKKGFDCVAFKRQAQSRIYEQIKGLSPEEEIEYFRRAADEGPLGNWWKKLRRSPTGESAGTRQRTAQP